MNGEIATIGIMEPSRARLLKASEAAADGVISKLSHSENLAGKARI